MVGLATASMKTQLGPLLTGIVLAEQWLPAPGLQFPGVMDFLQVYQAKAQAAGVDPLGFFLPPFAYARMQVLEQAVNATGTLDDGKLADYIRGHSFGTVVGNIEFGQDGEWANSRMLWTQFRDIKNNDLVQFRDTSTEVVLLPKAFTSGELVTPFQAGKP
jgi:branched-chain amino acid transport system substrate-binding protein